MLTIKKLLAFNKVWRSYRIVPLIFTSLGLALAYKIIGKMNFSNASWDVGAILSGTGILIERILSSYAKTGNDVQFLYEKEEKYTPNTDFMHEKEPKISTKTQIRQSQHYADGE